MANPFTTGPFNCCTCPAPPGYDPLVNDPLPKYRNKCGCPTATLECVSEQKVATLCGFSEFEDTDADPAIEASVPPKKYTTSTTDYTNKEEQRYQCCDPEGYKIRVDTTTKVPGQWLQVYDLENCVKSTISQSSPIITTKIYDCSGSLLSSSDSSTSVSFDTEYTDSTTFRRFELDRTVLDSGGDCDGKVFSHKFTKFTETLSVEDTEAAALTRATSTEGTSCSSLYQLRTTSFTFTQRTSTYTATASNLVIGVQYEGCVRIRRREAYSGTVPSGADTAWYDVEPDTIAAFTATATEEEVATDVALPNVQGYEYEVVGAYVWPTSAGCDCPTSYVAP